MQSVKYKVYHARDVVDSLHSVSINPTLRSPSAPADSVIQITNTDGQLILLQSSIFTYNYGQQHDNNMLPIKKEQDFDLYRAVMHIEQLVKQALIANNPTLAVEKNLFQSTYDDEGIARLETANNFIAYSWTGDREIEQHELGHGKYQFIIHASHIFQDQNEYKYAFEINQLRFKELKDFLFTEEKNIPLISLDQFGNIFSDIGSALSGIQDK